MVYLMPIQYHKTKYPEYISAIILEVVGNFYSKSVNVNGKYSLHTEDRYREREIGLSIV
jgi:hypothetical protein